MRIEVNIDRKYFWGISVVLAIIVFVSIVYAFDSVPANPVVFGHSADEYAVKTSTGFITIQEVASSLSSSGVYPANVPSGAIMMFTGNCPAGWTRFTELDNKVPRGANTYGGIGGEETHSHAITYNKFLDADTTAWRDKIMEISIDSASSWPPYRNVVWCKK